MSAWSNKGHVWFSLMRVGLVVMLFGGVCMMLNVANLRLGARLPGLDFSADAI
jgi:hypothetical protein